jgi:spore maturation protein CgeB
LNRLRRARIDAYVDETFSNATALINAIMDERFKELAFEGFRFWDLKRNNLPVERSASDAAEAWRTLPATSHRFVLPIPNDEILANPNMVQNDNY